MPDDQIKATYEHHVGNDLTVANAARVSFGKRSSMVEDEHGVWRLKDADKRLIQFLASGYTADDYDAVLRECTDAAGRIIFSREDDHKVLTLMQGIEDLEKAMWAFRDKSEHKSPFNHCFATFVVDAPMYVARQLVKHEYMPWNEMSGRYIELNNMFTPSAYRSKVRDKKQGSGANIEDEDHFALKALFTEHNHDSYKAYKDAIAWGLCEEQARGLLPLNTMTTWWWSGSLGAFAKMCRLRLAPDAQYESRLVAQQISNKMLELYPVAWKSLVLREFD